MFESTVEHFDGDSLQSEHLQHIIFAIKEYKNSLSNCSRTSTLWIQCLYHIVLVKHFIYAERTADWNLHLVIVKCILDLFVAAGRASYAKSERLYLQSIDALPEQHPWLQQCLQEKDYHAVRRSERYWAGLWSDLVLEQILMRSVKSRVGSNRGRGMDENTITMWIYSMNRLAGIHCAISSSSLTSQIHETCE